MENATREAVLAALGEAYADRTAPEIAAQTGLPEADIIAALPPLLDQGQAIAVSETAFVSGAAGSRLETTATKTLTQFHKRNPYKAVLPYCDLRAALQKAANVRDGDALFHRLQQRGILERTPNGVRLPGFAIVLPPKWAEAAAEILSVFVAGGLTDPPWHGNFQAHYPRDVPIDALLSALCERGDLAKLSADLYVATASIDAAIRTLRELSANGTPLTIGAVRGATGASRRVIVPLLEYLDKRGVTVRDGEARYFKKQTHE